MIRKPKTKKDLTRNLLMRSFLLLPSSERIAVMWNAFNNDQDLLTYYELKIFIPSRLRIKK